jgi:hypothetical protein
MKNEKMLLWFKQSLKKDKIDIEKDKMNFISEIKKYKREDIIPAPKKTTLWQKIRKVLNF